MNRVVDPESIRSESDDAASAAEISLVADESFPQDQGAKLPRADVLALIKSPSQSRDTIYRRMTRLGSRDPFQA